MHVIAVLLAAASSLAGTAADVADLTPREKAALVVVSSPPAPVGVAGVLVHGWETEEPRPAGALVMVDQEGGSVRAYPSLPPSGAAASYTSSAEARAAGRAAGRALRRVGVRVDLAPVVDLPDGPLGSRHFPRPSYAVAFARGLAAAGVAACAKHFPGLGSTATSTDGRVPVHGVVRRREVAAFRAAIRGGVPCVMVSHAIYPRLGGRPASLEPGPYRLLREQGFTGVAITDELGVLGNGRAAEWARRAVVAGADLVLYSSPDAARAAIDALVPLARRGVLDEHLMRVLRFRAAFTGP
jgi:beta-N-acetylhexosaminidase